MLDLFPPMLNGTLREHYLLLFGAAGAIALVVGAGGAMVGAWFGARRASRRAVQDAAREAAREASRLSEAQLVALREGMEAIALEVERISEGQRFATRLLSERAAHPPVAQPMARREPGVTTPH